jgi:hypothetical protein
MQIPSGQNVLAALRTVAKDVERLGLALLSNII